MCGPNMRGKFGTPAAVSAALTMAAITASAYGLNPRVIVNNNKEKPSTEKPIQVDKPGNDGPFLSNGTLYTPQCRLPACKKCSLNDSSVFDTHLLNDRSSMYIECKT